MKPEKAEEVAKMLLDYQGDILIAPAGHMAGQSAKKAAGLRSKPRKPGDKTINAARDAAGLD